MNRLCFSIVAVFFVGCFGDARVYQREQIRYDRDRIIYIAKQELERQKATLPPNCEIVIEDAEMGDEIEAPRKVYQVSFRFEFRGKKQIVYTVMIEKRTGKVILFSDSRTHVPSEV